jgi:hypothetical protein
MKPLVVYGIEDLAVIERLLARLDGCGRTEGKARVVAQDVIEYIRSQGGLTYWSHLEEDKRIRLFTAEMVGKRRPELLRGSRGYSVFGVFPNGYEENCQPGGRWGGLLAERVRMWPKSHSSRWPGSWASGMKVSRRPRRWRPTKRRT